MFEKIYFAYTITLKPTSCSTQFIVNQYPICFLRSRGWWDNLIHIVCDKIVMKPVTSIILVFVAIPNLQLFSSYRIDFSIRKDTIISKNAKPTNKLHYLVQNKPIDKLPVNITLNLIKHYADSLRLELSLSDSSQSTTCLMWTVQPSTTSSLDSVTATSVNSWQYSLAAACVNASVSRLKVLGCTRS